MSQSDKWLLIYGREKAKLEVASKNKVSFQRKGSSIVLKCYQIFKGLVVLSIHMRDRENISYL